MMISVLLLSGCDTVHVNNHAPFPFYPSCEAVRHCARPETPDACWRDLKNMTVIMEQLRHDAGLPDDFGECQVD